MRQSAILFSGGLLRDALAKESQRALAEVEGVPEEHLLQVDVDQWAQALAEKWAIEVPVLLEGDKASGSVNPSGAGLPVKRGPIA